MAKPTICAACRGTGQWTISTVTGSRTRKKDCPICTGLGVQGIAWVNGDGGIYHIVQRRTPGGWLLTACQTFEPSDEPEHFEPKRRCKKCVARVKAGRPWQEGAEGWPAGLPKSEAA